MLNTPNNKFSKEKEKTEKKKKKASTQEA